MAIRILFQDLYTKMHPGFDSVGGGYAAVDAGMMQVAKKVLRPDTIVVHRWVPRSTYNTDMFWTEMLNNTEIVHEIIKADKEGGFDAAIIGCGNDPGLEAAREMVQMPVIGVLETGMLIACILGAKFACILTDPRCIPLVERKIKLYGMEDRAISYKPARAADCHPENVPLWFEPTGDAKDLMISSFDKTAKECIADGAEVLVTACAYWSALTLHGHLKVEGTEAPICEGLALGIKMAEYLADIRNILGISTSRVLTYAPCPWVPKEVIEGLTEAFFQK
jgi:allantoin racemase